MNCCTIVINCPVLIPCWNYCYTSYFISIIQSSFPQRASYLPHLNLPWLTQSSHLAVHFFCLCLSPKMYWDFKSIGHKPPLGQVAIFHSSIWTRMITLKIQNGVHSYVNTNLACWKNLLGLKRHPESIDEGNPLISICTFYSLFFFNVLVVCGHLHNVCSSNQFFWHCLNHPLLSRTCLKNTNSWGWVITASPLIITDLTIVHGVGNCFIRWFCFVQKKFHPSILPLQACLYFQMPKHLCLPLF